MRTARDNCPTAMRAAHCHRPAATRASYDTSAAAMDGDSATAMHSDRSAAVRATHGNRAATMDPTSTPSVKAADQNSAGCWRDGAWGVRLDVDAICEIAAGDHDHDGGSERN